MRKTPEENKYISVKNTPSDALVMIFLPKDKRTSGVCTSVILLYHDAGWFATVGGASIPGSHSYNRSAAHDSLYRELTTNLINATH